MIKTLHAGEFLHLLRDRHWEYVKRPHSTGAVFIVAVTEARELLLVEQMRIPLQARTLELPAGIMGDSAAFATESPEQSALRELLEETGYQGTTATRLCQGPIAPGLTSEQSFYVRVEGLTRVHAGGGVDDEDITVRPLPLDDLPRALQAFAARGVQVDPKIYIALHFLGTPKNA